MQDDASIVREGLIQQIRLGSPASRRQALALVPKLGIEMPGNWLDWLIEAAADPDPGVRHEAGRQLALWHRRDPYVVAGLRSRVMPLLQAGLRQAEGTGRLEWAKAVIAWRDRTEPVDSQVLALFEEYDPAAHAELARWLLERPPFDPLALDQARRTGLLAEGRGPPARDLKLNSDWIATECLSTLAYGNAPSPESSRIVALAVRSASEPLTPAEVAELRNNLWHAPADARLAAFRVLLRQLADDSTVQQTLIARVLTDPRNLAEYLQVLAYRHTALSKFNQRLVVALQLGVALDPRRSSDIRLGAVGGVRIALGQKPTDPPNRNPTWIDRLEARILGVRSILPPLREDELWHDLWYSPFRSERLTDFRALSRLPVRAVAKHAALLARVATDRTNRSRYLELMQFGDLERTQWGGSPLLPITRRFVTVLQLSTALDPRQDRMSRLSALYGVQSAWKLTPADPPSGLRSFSQWLERRISPKLPGSGITSGP